MTDITDTLDPNARSPEAKEFEDSLRSILVGQDRAIRQMARIYQIWRAGLIQDNRPVASLLLLGPTGSGKTRLVEAVARALYGKEDAILRVDCAEFQHTHEISKLTGSPPGYLGHRETEPILTQEKLSQHHTEKVKLSLVLFDEIEKANASLWQLLLGILDKAALTLGDNRKVDFSSSIIFMTSNLGAREMDDTLSGGLGFSPHREKAEDQVDQKLYRLASGAAKRRFSPEFMNRIDRLIVFRRLRREHLERILDIELSRIQDRILRGGESSRFCFSCTPEAKDFLIREGTDPRMGARPLRRALERHLVTPFANLVATGQVVTGDMVEVGCENGSLSFKKRKI